MPSSALPVEVVCTSGPVPIVASGRATFTGGLYTIHFDGDVSMAPVGGKAILSFSTPDVPRVIARVESAHGNQMVCTPEQHRNRERRDFPRMHAGLPLRARRLTLTERTAEAEAWLRGDPGPAERGDWYEPDRFVDFSVTGLRIQIHEEMASDDVLLLELGVPGNPARWRCTARVVRIFDEVEGMSAAIEFVSIPDAAQEALSGLTLRMQEALLAE